MLQELLLDTAEALRPLHALNRPHNDLKPWNIQVDEDVATVLDLGMAHTLERIKAKCMKLGNPAYRAPEARGELDITTFQPTLKMDIFSLGRIACGITSVLTSARLLRRLFVIGKPYGLDAFEDVNNKEMILSRGSVLCLAVSLSFSSPL